MKAKGFLSIALLLLSTSTSFAQTTPVFGAFVQQVDWSDWSHGIWIPSHTEQYQYRFCGELLVVAEIITLHDSKETARDTVWWDNEGFPIQILKQEFRNDSTWLDLSKTTYHWEHTHYGQDLITSISELKKGNKEWHTTTDCKYDFEFDIFGRKKREIISCLDTLSGNFFPIQRTRFSYDHYGHVVVDTVEIHSGVDWQFFQKTEYFYPQHKDSLFADSMKIYHWVPANEVWALSWWKPDFRYLYLRKPGLTQIKKEVWDEIAFHWDTASVQTFHTDQFGNTLLNLIEKYRDFYWEKGRWRTVSGQRWNIDWENGIPKERIAQVWTKSTDTTGYWENSTREVFSDFWVSANDKFINKALDTDWKVYPNPFQDILFLKTSIHNQKNGSLYLIDPAGKVHFEKKYSTETTFMKLDLGFLPRGNYLLIFSDQRNKMVLKKLLKR
jgi:hypothetical protein